MATSGFRQGVEKVAHLSDRIDDLPADLQDYIYSTVHYPQEGALRNDIENFVFVRQQLLYIYSSYIYGEASSNDGASHEETESQAVYQFLRDDLLRFLNDNTPYFSPELLARGDTVEERLAELTDSEAGLPRMHITLNNLERCRRHRMSRNRLIKTVADAVWFNMHLLLMVDKPRHVVNLLLGLFSPKERDLFLLIARIRVAGEIIMTPFEGGGLDEESLDLIVNWPRRRPPPTQVEEEDEW